VKREQAHEWIWSETARLPHAETTLEVARELLAERTRESARLAASLLDRAWGAQPTHDGLRMARDSLLDALSVSEHGVRWRFVPAGWFRQGSEDGDDDERPRRRVELDAFWIADAPLDWVQVATMGGLTPPPMLAAPTDREGVEPLVDWFARRILAQYSRAKLPPSARPPELPPDTPQYVLDAIDDSRAEAFSVLPAVAIGWPLAERIVGHRCDDSVTYALPTEAQWERAARGGLPDARYPWGDAEPSPRLADYDAFERFSLRPAREFSPNGYGLYAMAGTVHEWCADWYDALAYCDGPARNPVGPPSGKQRVLRGGSWADCAATLRVSFRSAAVPTTRCPIPTVGLRPVRLERA
jgi:formylglycine-generating enzyme required for sulfatase activity